MLTNIYSALLIMFGLTIYMYISIYGVLNIKAELKPDQLFLKSSDVIKVLFCITINIKETFNHIYIYLI